MTPGIHIASPDEAKTVSRILAQAFEVFRDLYTKEGFDATVISPEEVKSRMQRGRVWLAGLDGRSAGTASGYIQTDTFYIQGMAVSPSARGRKLGYHLLLTIENHARDQGCRSLLLSTTPYLKKAIWLYEKFGFRIINEPPYEFYGTPLFNMKKKL